MDALFTSFLLLFFGFMLFCMALACLIKFKKTQYKEWRIGIFVLSGCGLLCILCAIPFILNYISIVNNL